MQENFLRLSERGKVELLGAIPAEVDIMKLADYFQNFADQTRIKILTCLSMKSMCVTDISRILKINQTTISHQLKLLKDQELVTYKREGKILIYSLIDSSVNEIMLHAIKSRCFV